MILARALLIETVLAILKVNVLIKVEQMPGVVPRFVNFLFNTITYQSFTNFTFLSFRDSVFVAYVSILKLMKYPLYYLVLISFMCPQYSDLNDSFNSYDYSRSHMRSIGG